MTIYLSIERDLAAGPHKSGRFRCKIWLGRVGGKLLFMSAFVGGSVAAAKRDAEEAFGEIDWRETPLGEDNTTRATAEVEFD